MTVSQAADHPPVAVRPLAGRLQFYALGLLFLVYVLNFLDRQIVNILAEDIRNELGLKDWQIGAMTGLSFAIFYSILGLPIARVAERGDRPRIIATSIIIWSAFTGLCGLAQTFVQFALARVGVGGGEAGCTPPAHSLISDYVPREKRASALAFYAMGGPVGGLAGMAMGGVIGDIWGWRSAFFIAAVPGILLGLVTAFTLAEPRRAIAAAGQGSPSPKLRDGLRELRACRTYWLFLVGTTLSAIVSYGHSSFLASFYLRNHGEGLARLGDGFGLPPTSFLGLAVGLLTGLGGVAGALAGGRIADRWSAESARGYASLAALATLLSVPPYIIAMLAPWTEVAVRLLFLPIFCSSLALGSMYAVPQSVVRPQLRATATAVLLFNTNLFGMGVGPVVVGAFSDYLQAHGLTDGEAIRFAQIAATMVGVVAAGFYWRARKTIEADMKS